MFELSGAVFAWLENISRSGASISSELLSILKHVLDVAHGSRFANDDVISIDDRARINDTVVIKFIIGTESHILSLSVVWPLKQLILVLSIGISAEEG